MKKAFLLGLPLVVTPVYADTEIDNSLQLPNVTVLATRIPSAQTVTNVTVITREQIESRQATNVLELLRSEAGLHVTQSSRGGHGSLFMRNGDPNYVMIMINGVRMNDPTNNRGGSYDLSRLSLDAVERIEILKGSSSAIYGSDALSGVINIITRSSSGGNGAVVSFGSPDYSEASGQYSLSTATIRSSLKMAFVNETTRTGGNYQGYNQHLDSAWRFGSGLLQLQAHHRNSSAQAFPDDSGGLDYAVLRDLEQNDSEEYALSVNVKQISNLWVHQFQSSWMKQQSQVDSPGIAPGIRNPFGIPANTSDDTIQREYLTWFSSFKSPHLAMSGGLDYVREKAEGQSAFFGAFAFSGSYAENRHNTGVFSELQLNPYETLKLQAGLRLDDPDKGGTVFSPNLGFGLGDKTRLFFNWGKGYKLPSFYALYHPIVGNTSLRPERSHYWELRLSRPFSHGEGQGKGQMELSLFKTDYRDLVDFDAGTMVNRSSVVSEGLELTVNHVYNTKIKNRFNATYNKTVDQNSQEPLLQRPKHKANWDLEYQFSRSLTAHGTMLYVGQILDSSIATNDLWLSSYTRWDTALTWRRDKHLRFIFKIQNLLDRDYQETIGNPAAGRTIRLSITVSDSGL